VKHFSLPALVYPSLSLLAREGKRSFSVVVYMVWAEKRTAKMTV